MKKLLLSFVAILFLTNIQAQSVQIFAQLDTAITCNSPIFIDVLANDILPSSSIGPALIVGSEINWGGRYFCDTCQSKEGGVFRTVGDTIIHYTPPANFIGWDEIHYLLTDDTLGLRNHYDSARVAIYVDTCSTVSLSEISIENSFHIFPNPAQSITTIALRPSAAAYELKVYDLRGALVFDYPKVTASKITLDLSELSEGVYLVELKQGNEIQRKKLVVN